MTESWTHAFLRREQERKLRELQPMLERLSQTVCVSSLPPPTEPPAFVDPLEQLELGRGEPRYVWVRVTVGSGA